MAPKHERGTNAQAGPRRAKSLPKRAAAWLAAAPTALIKEASVLSTQLQPQQHHKSHHGIQECALPAPAQAALKAGWLPPAPRAQPARGE